MQWGRGGRARRRAGKFGITPCIPPKSNRKVQYRYDKAVSKKRHRIENLFAKIKDWRRIHTRYDRCAHTFMSAIAIAATVIFWLRSMSPDPGRTGLDGAGIVGCANEIAKINARLVMFNQEMGLSDRIARNMEPTKPDTE